MVLDQLQAALRARILRFTDNGDPSEILDEAAVAEAAQLWQAALSASPTGELPVAVVQTLASLHWHRSQVLPAGDGQDDLWVAATLAGALIRVDPALIPEQLHPLLLNYLVPDRLADLPDL